MGAPRERGMIAQDAVSAWLFLAIFSGVVFTFYSTLVHFLVAVRSRMVAVRSNGDISRDQDTYVVVTT